MKDKIKFLDVAMTVFIAISLYNIVLSIKVNKHLLKTIKEKKQNGIKE
jgi:hypothetical protein